MASVGVFCSLCYAEMANGIELRQHISEKHPNVFELSDEDAAAVRLAVMNASGMTLTRAPFTKVRGDAYSI